MLNIYMYNIPPNCLFILLTCSIQVVNMYISIRMDKNVDPGQMASPEEPTNLDLHVHVKCVQQTTGLCFLYFNTCIFTLVIS